jgi:hypothetical protein
MTNFGRILNACRLKAIPACTIALVSFAAGSLMTSRLLSGNQVRADSHRVFELRVYHAVPGKVPALESRFRTIVTPLFARHGLNPVGFWIPEDAPASGNTFIYILAHPSREDARKNWEAMFNDPGFAEIVKDEAAEKLVEGVDSTYMDPTDFSPMN